MAARPGEENVATLFGDIHYFYGPPTNNPPHHRFDKGSYVYLFEDAQQGRARIEIANQPGTEDQDAFDGYLDRVHVHYSYKRTCLVTLTVGDVEGYEEWHLPTYDPHNQAKYHYKLHSLDIYFWTQQDALQFVNGIRRVLPPAQCEVLDEPGPPPRQPAAGDLSAVVQKLERAAISTEEHQQAGGNPTGLAIAAPTFPGPPVSAVAGGDGVPPPPPAQFVPMAYNPAAPAAPEQVRHREKTPPPEDGVANPLHQTLAYDAGTPFSPGLTPGSSVLSPLSPGIPPPTLHHPPGAPSFPGPPQQHVASPGFAPQGFGSLAASQAPPPHLGIVRASTMPTGVAPQTYGHVQQQQQPATTNTPPPPPPATAPPADPYALHQQFYVPEGGGQYKPPKEEKGHKGRFEDGAGKLERGVTGLLKRVEKKFG